MSPQEAVKLGIIFATREAVLMHIIVAPAAVFERNFPSSCRFVDLDSVMWKETQSSLPTTDCCPFKVQAVLHPCQG
jgi:hypothetical protein